MKKNKKKKTKTKQKKQLEIHAKRMALMIHDGDTLDEMTIIFRLSGEKGQPDMFIKLEGTDILDITQNLNELIKSYFKTSNELDSIYS